MYEYHISGKTYWQAIKNFIIHRIRIIAYTRTRLMNFYDPICQS